MKNICFYFQVHQPFRLANYHFFDIGSNKEYFDEEANASILRKVAHNCYFPTNKLLLDLIKEHGNDFKVSFSISGTALDQFERYLPEVIDSFKALAETGCVEFLGETYAHSLSILKSKEEFKSQAQAHSTKIEKLFGQKPTIFRNTELIYADFIADAVAELGFKGILAEGAAHVLDWKSPNYLYYSANQPRLKLLLKNFRLSDDIAFRFSDRNWSEHPLTAEKYINWLNTVSHKEEIINLFMDYETFGEHQWQSTGIFDFMRVLPSQVLSNSDYQFITPSDAVKYLQPVASISMPVPVSWADAERDLSAWLGNDLQDDAFDTLYALEQKVKMCNNKKIQQDWLYLQTSDHFYYMCTKFFSDGDVHKYFNPYGSPYDAFINYMNVLTDFSIRVNKLAESKELKPTKSLKTKRRSSSPSVRTSY
ncbi:MAG: glycoside hydrolase family 57 protein [Bacteroidetes bacterium]|nr:glycoside hydrolase family 57 protein [Bacteroidota bacterium]